MSTDLMPFDYEGHTVRTVTVDDAPWFVARDVCAVLGISNGRDALSGLDEDEKGVATADTPGGPQQVAIVNEYGLYSLILRSRKPEAKAFKRWVTHEVLPQIRRTGAYVPAQRALPTKRELALMVIEAEDRAEAAEKALAEAKPAADSWKALAEAKGDHALREAAQILSRDPYIEIGQNRLAKYLRKLKWVDGQGRPYQRHVETGRLVVRTRTYDHPHTGEPQLTTQLRITPKGLSELHKRLRGEDRDQAGVLSLIDGGA